MVIFVLLAVGIGVVVLAVKFGGRGGKSSVTMDSKDRKLFREITPYFDGYREVFQKYPASYEELIDLEWIRSVPVDRYARQIAYKRDVNEHGYELRSAGKDGRFGNDDDACFRSVSSQKITLYFYSCKEENKP